MDSSDAVSHWIERLKGGDHEAAQRLWEGYFHRLVGLARARLQGVPRAAGDEEDVALSAFNSFCRGAARGRFSRLSDRDDLWQLLVLLTARKALHLRRDQNRLKRGGGRVVSETTLQSSEEEESALAQILDTQPSPQFAAEVAEECERLLGRLEDAPLRQIALLKMEGHTNDEIAARLDCGLRTVERKLERIRTIWENEVGK
jgi:DNA-directed RNA polymerase specialized sigma24 family protein